MRLRILSVQHDNLDASEIKSGSIGVIRSQESNKECVVQAIAMPKILKIEQHNCLEHLEKRWNPAL
ncbi:hypothetical protein IQ276_033090 [Desmonostoc muscorum LEGE 12446]|uniref:Uncharacterized protein n=1 Tax=Desmonostoc muscorum LEGE 12446 TaxID=1828758 RepID=A0A8J6ZTA9_DESMC|nr:hypothetical protein [Desmonostoc muscorum]MCF2151177.1 hypothetical protein [Desmonostoc muscorum LEGE 12446]